MPRGENLHEHGAYGLELNDKLPRETLPYVWNLLDQIVEDFGGPEHLSGRDWALVELGIRNQLIFKLLTDHALKVGDLSGKGPLTHAARYGNSARRIWAALDVDVDPNDLGDPSKRIRQEYADGDD